MRDNSSKRRDYTRDSAPRATADSTSLISNKALLGLIVLAAVLLTCSLWMPSAQDIAALSARMSDLWASATSTVAGLFESSKSAAPDMASKPQSAPIVASCGNAGAFNSLFSGLIEVVDGVLGKVLAVMVMLLGGVAAVMRGSPLPAMMGIVHAAMLSFMPTVLVALAGC